MTTTATTENGSRSNNGYTYPLPSGTIVRYEASQDGRTISVTLHVDVAGHEGVVSYHDGLRFRWPTETRA